MTPAAAVIVVPSTLTPPTAAAVPSGSLAGATVPLVIFVALVVSIVAEGAKASPFSVATVGLG